MQVWNLTGLTWHEVVVQSLEQDQDSTAEGLRKDGIAQNPPKVIPLCCITCLLVLSDENVVHSVTVTFDAAHG